MIRQKKIFWVLDKTVPVWQNLPDTVSTVQVLGFGPSHTSNIHVILLLSEDISVVLLQ